MDFGGIFTADDLPRSLAPTILSHMAKQKENCAMLRKIALGPIQVKTPFQEHQDKKQLIQELKDNCDEDDIEMLYDWKRLLDSYHIPSQDAFGARYDGRIEMKKKDFEYALEGLEKKMEDVDKSTAAYESLVERKAFLRDLIWDLPEKYRKR